MPPSTFDLSWLQVQSLAWIDSLVSTQSIFNRNYGCLWERHARYDNLVHTVNENRILVQQQMYKLTRFIGELLGG